MTKIIFYILTLSVGLSALAHSDEKIKQIGIGNLNFGSFFDAGVTPEKEKPLIVAENDLVSAMELLTAKEIADKKLDNQKSADSFINAILSSGTYGPYAISERDFDIMQQSYNQEKERLNTLKPVSDADKKNAIRKAELAVTEARFKLLNEFDLPSKIHLDKYRAIKKDNSDIYFMDSEGRIFIWSAQDMSPSLAKPRTKEWDRGISLLTKGDPVQAHSSR
jgi:hypothetical protein